MALGKVWFTRVFVITLLTCIHVNGITNACALDNTQHIGHTMEQDLIDVIATLDTYITVTLQQAETVKSFSAVMEKTHYMSALLKASSLLADCISVTGIENHQFQRIYIQVATINQKLMTIKHSLRDVTPAIAHDAGMMQYSPSVHSLRYGFHQMIDLYAQIQRLECTGDNNNCVSTLAYMKEYFMEDFAVAEDFDLIMNSCVEPIATESLLNAMSKTYSCDFATFDDFESGLLILAIQAQQTIVQYEVIAGSNISRNRSIDNYVTKVYRFLKQLSQMRENCYKVVGKQIRRDFRQFIKNTPRVHVHLHTPIYEKRDAQSNRILVANTHGWIGV